MSLPERRQRLEIGGFRALKRGGPPIWHDLYYHALEQSWPRFIAVASVIFLLVNALFGLVYMALPGAILNARPGSFADGFFFSVETLATVGYGNMAPATLAAHLVATAEIMCGILITATITGLTFARFARPRQSIAVSDVAVVGLYDGQEALMIRVASFRAQPIADVTAQLGCIEEVGAGDGGPTFRRVAYLPLVRQHNAMLAMNWTIAHIIDPEGPLNALLRDPARADDPFRLILTVGGLDTMLSTPTFGGRYYRRHEVHLDHDFVDMIEEKDDAFEVHLDKLHQTRPRQATGVVGNGAGGGSPSLPPPPAA